MAWDGPQFAPWSWSLANREHCRELLASRKVAVALVNPGPDLADVRDDPRFAALAQAASRPVAGAADVHVCRRWPPPLSPPPQGRWVFAQSWEYGSIPRAWVEPLRTLADEVWAPSAFVRDAYVRSGIDADRVVVVPYGVDPARFHSGVPPTTLPTDKGFRFLYATAAIERKGIDLLLDVYLRTFSPDDDVCLVVKDNGADSIYRGQSWRKRIRALQADPGVAEILYLDQAWPHAAMAGLYTTCDALVHPYRGEGFPMPIAEAMACGLPVVVPAHGACLAFCDPSTAYLVPADEVRLPARRVGDLDLVEDVRWAELDRSELGVALRRVFQHPDDARLVGRRASAKIHSEVTWAHAGDVVLDRLEALATRPVRRLQPPAPPRGEPAPAPNTGTRTRTDTGIEDPQRLPRRPRRRGVPGVVPDQHPWVGR